jgi:signal transduction histidine kinase
MGLFIAKTLTEAQNGRIWVDTEPGVGSTYNVLIPLAGYTPVDVNANE